MKVITIQQPWAQLIALGEKKFETRSWRTKYRGGLGIHAGKTVDKEAYEDFKDILKSYGIKSIGELPKGAILATSTLVDCFEVIKDFGGYAQLEDKGYIPFSEYQLGNFSVGRYAWKLENIKLLKQLIPAKGQLSLWEFKELNDNGYKKEIQAYDKC